MCFVSWYSSGTENATKPNAIASSACFSPIATEGEVRHARRGSPRARPLPRHAGHERGVQFRGARTERPPKCPGDLPTTEHNVSPTYLATYDVLRMSR